MSIKRIDPRLVFNDEQLADLRACLAAGAGHECYEWRTAIDGPPRCFLCGSDVVNECPEFRPDHNGECLNCDEPGFAHRTEIEAVHQSMVKVSDEIHDCDPDCPLYAVARMVCHEVGIPWTDPRTGITYQPGTKP